MKIGTDGVLLGVKTNYAEANHILYVDTGSRFIALMMAQKTSYYLCHRPTTELF